MVDLETIAGHEAAHAVMRWIRGLPATELTASESGGLCAGTGKPARDEDLLLVWLAGVAWETGCGLAKLDFRAQGPFADLDNALELLRSKPYLRWRWDGKRLRVVSARAALSVWIEKAGCLLSKHIMLVDSLGHLLASRRRLSARSVSAILREYEKRLERQAATSFIHGTSPDQQADQGRHARRLDKAMKVKTLKAQRRGQSKAL